VRVKEEPQDDAPSLPAYALAHLHHAQQQQQQVVVKHEGGEALQPAAQPPPAPPPPQQQQQHAGPLQCSPAKQDSISRANSAADMRTAPQASAFAAAAAAAAAAAIAAAGNSSSQPEQQQQQLLQQLSSLFGSATGLPNLPAASGGEPSSTPAGSAGTSAAAAIAAAPALPALPDAEEVSREVSDALLQLISALNEQDLLSCDDALEMGDALEDLPGNAAAAAAFMQRAYRQLAVSVRRGNGRLATAVLRKHLLPPQQQ
jgi:hypothetical protein